jgi:hypothetical protein
VPPRGALGADPIRHNGRSGGSFAMLILKFGFASVGLLGLHEFLLHHGDRIGANIITGAVAFLILLIIGLTRESFT